MIQPILRQLTLCFVGGAIACSSQQFEPTNPHLSTQADQKSEGLPAAVSTVFISPTNEMGEQSAHFLESSDAVITASTSLTNTYHLDNSMSSSAVEVSGSLVRTSSMHSLTLVAQESRIPALGQRDHSEGSMGFAAVTLHVENPFDSEYQLTLQSLEIISLSTQRVLFRQTNSQTLTLMPSDKEVLNVQLMNQVGFPETQHVRAIASYQLTSDTSTMEYRVKSAPVQVERSSQH